VHGGGRALVGLALGGASVLRHELAEHDEHRIGECCFQRDRGRGEHGTAPARVEAGQMLDGEPSRLVGEALEGGGREGRRTGAVDPEALNVA
jgi:hypothetical protein